jgi:ATP-dependent DNA helicase RecG
MMSSSFDKLRRILSLEARQGHRDQAVLGGVAQFLQYWEKQARDEPISGADGRLDAVILQLATYQAMSVSERRRAVHDVLALLDAPPDRPAASLEPVKQRRTPPAKPAHQAQEGTRSPTRKATPRDEARAPLPSLSAPVTRLKGVGPANAERLATLGIHTIRDLIYHFPRRYDNFGELKQISQLELDDEVTVVGVVRSAALVRRTGRSMFRATLSDGTGAIECTWFNQPYLERSLKAGAEIVVSGKVGEYLGRLVFTAPEWEPLQADLLHTARLVPVYPLTEGLNTRSLRKLIKETLDTWVPQVVDPLPQDVRASAGLIDLRSAIMGVHFPADEAEMLRARERLCFDELLLLQLGILRKRGEWRKEQSVSMHVAPEVTASLISELPFALTGAQQRAIEAILADLAQPVPMSRLLQGDVGSGKTVVALAAMVVAAKAGYQAALMAPTAILAQQHADTIGRLLATMPEICVALLEGGQSAQVKARVREELAQGWTDIVIGTHALIQEGVAFPRLGLVIVDEQHRFGVTQRETLRDKNGAFRPHMLAMSATPIPRTLALTIYGDLDVTVLDELPPYRQPVVTAVRTQASREPVYAFVRSQVEKGHQAYVICPLVEESDQIEARAAVEEHQRLARDIFPQFRVGLLHGRVGAEEKERVMSAFKAGEYDILVSTAVVEVGMDVPNATVMLIEGAERFGLAQLHQFRGRVGRGEAKSYCVLLSDSATEEHLARLQILEDTNDGFVLAEKDLELRGPGDFLGVRQHGLPELKVAQLSDRHTLDLARSEAIKLFESDPDLSASEHHALAASVDRFWTTVSRA